MRKMTLIAILFSALFIFSSSALAISDLEPGSLLIYPFFSSDPGKDTLISVTNINTDPVYNPLTGLLLGSVYAHFFYIDGEDCDITDRREFLTPGDTLTVLASLHNPAMNSGWLYVVAENDYLLPCEFDGIDSLGFPTGLIGDTIVADGLANALWSIPAIGIKALNVPFKNPTDINNNGFMDLTGLEYEVLPGTLYISSFIEQGFGSIIGELVLLSFVLDMGQVVDGGANVDVRVDLDFLFYNNNEVVFSQEDEMRCWMVRKLDEIFNGSDSLGGAPAIVPTGWVTIMVEDGVDTASGQNVPRQALPILGMLIQRVGSSSYSCARLLHHITEGIDDVIGSLDID